MLHASCSIFYALTTLSLSLISCPYPKGGRKNESEEFLLGSFGPYGACRRRNTDGYLGGSSVWVNVPRGRPEIESSLGGAFLFTKELYNFKNLINLRLSPSIPKPGKMRESFVGLGHPMRIFPFLYCRAGFMKRVDNLRS